MLKALSSFIKKSEPSSAVNKMDEGAKNLAGRESHTKEENALSKELEAKYRDFEFENIDILLRVNDLLKYMTELDYVKNMIIGVNDQLEMTEDIVSSSEELSKATEDISDFVQNSNQTMDSTVRQSEVNLEKINNTFAILEESIEETNNVKFIMDEVIVETKEIEDMVVVINQVAEQTNLLALNASIEAARAGDHGRGFAVVANEIKKLSENTKEQVRLIQDVVNNLNLKIVNTSKRLDEVVESFHLSTKDMEEASRGVKNISSSMYSVGDSLVEISSNVEEQTAATEEMSANLMVISDKSNNLRGETIKTGQAFFDISGIVDDVRRNMIRITESVNNEQMIDIVTTDHLMWKWKIYNMILGHIHMEESDVEEYTECRLGQWICKLDRSDRRINELLVKLDVPHDRLHKSARQAIGEYNRGNNKRAEEILSELEDYSIQVVDYLQELKYII